MDICENGIDLAARLRECCKSGKIDWELVTASASYIETAARWIRALASDEIPPPVVPAKRRMKKSVTEAGKQKYGMYNNVRLTDEELGKLRERFSDASARIDKLSEYIEIKGDKYKSHYAVILKWVRDDEEKRQKESKVEGSSFDTDEFFELALKRSYNK